MHAVEGSLKAAKLPRVGSRLNASKPESELESGDAQYAEGGVQPEASASMTIVWGSSSAPSSRGRGSASSNSPPAVSQSFGDDKHLVGRHVRVREVLVPRVTECCFTTQIAPLDLGPGPLPEEEGPGTQPLTGGQDQYPRLSRVRESQPGRHVCCSSALQSPRAKSVAWDRLAVVLSQSVCVEGWPKSSAADVLVFCKTPSGHASSAAECPSGRLTVFLPVSVQRRARARVDSRHRTKWRRRQEPGQRTAAAALRALHSRPSLLRAIARAPSHLPQQTPNNPKRPISEVKQAGASGQQHQPTGRGGEGRGDEDDTRAGGADPRQASLTDLLTALCTSRRAAGTCLTAHRSTTVDTTLDCTTLQCRTRARAVPCRAPPAASGWWYSVSRAGRSSDQHCCQCHQQLVSSVPGTMRQRVDLLSIHVSLRASTSPGGHVAVYT